MCRNTEVQIDREKSEVSVSYELHGNVYYENPYKIGDFRTRFSVMTRPDGSFCRSTIGTKKIARTTFSSSMSFFFSQPADKRTEDYITGRFG